MLITWRTKTWGFFFFFCQKDNGNRVDFMSRRFSHVKGFCLHFYYISTILSDAYILSPISRLGFNLLTHSAHSPRCPMPHRGIREGLYYSAWIKAKWNALQTLSDGFNLWQRPADTKKKKNALNVIWSLYSMLNLWAIQLYLAEWLILKIDTVINYGSLMLKYVDGNINNRKLFFFFKDKR